MTTPGRALTVAGCIALYLGSLPSDGESLVSHSLSQLPYIPYVRKYSVIFYININIKIVFTFMDIGVLIFCVCDVAVCAFPRQDTLVVQAAFPAGIASDKQIQRDTWPLGSLAWGKRCGRPSSASKGSRGCGCRCCYYRCHVLYCCIMRSCFSESNVLHALTHFVFDLCYAPLGVCCVCCLHIKFFPLNDISTPSIRADSSS